MKIEEIQECMLDSIQKIQDFVTQVTGTEPSQQEIANALQKYFVLNEIKEHILLERNQG